MNTEIESIKTLTDTELKTVSPIRRLARLVSLQPFYVDDNAILFCGASEKVLPLIPENSIDLTVTSPPYDNLRTYKGFTFEFETIAKELYRVTKDGGVVAQTIDDFGIVDFIWHEKYKMIWADRVIVTRIQPDNNGV